MKDMINHPPHYTKGKIEVIDAIEDWKLDYHEGNVVKYIARAKHKGDELENLKKAQWYLNRLIEKKEADNRAVLDSIYGKGVIVQNYSDLPKDYKKPELKGKCDYCGDELDFLGELGVGCYRCVIGPAEKLANQMKKNEGKPGVEFYQDLPKDYKKPECKDPVCSCSPPGMRYTKMDGSYEVFCVRCHKKV